jgi:2-C-methyl-D-erythritol 2,4-cyclodiphosphate synthase
MRIGFGYDVHRLVEGRKLILGGVQVPYKKGLEGHSDADVLLHALCDALLGAMGEGDIGRHFPNTEPRFQGISSLRLLQNVATMMAERSLAVENLDTTVVAEQPLIGPYIPQMVEKIATTLEIPAGRVNIKATTSEGLGFIGEGKGVVAYAIVLLTSKSDIISPRRPLR